LRRRRCTKTTPLRRPPCSFRPEVSALPRSGMDLARLGACPTTMTRLELWVCPVRLRRGRRGHTLSYGPTGNKYPTAYSAALSPWRTQACSAAPRFAARAMTVRWFIHGVEIFRSNMPPASGYATLSTANLTGADETNWYAYAASPSLLVPGVNVLAAEVHQSGPTSGDLGFNWNSWVQRYRRAVQPPSSSIRRAASRHRRRYRNLLGSAAGKRRWRSMATRWRLPGRPVPIRSSCSPTCNSPNPVLMELPFAIRRHHHQQRGLADGDESASSAHDQRLIATNALWAYHDQGMDLGTAWRAPGYHDAGWSNGQAKLGYGGDGEVTRLSLAPTSATSTDLLLPPHLHGHARCGLYQPCRPLIRDDGAAIYLNGAKSGVRTCLRHLGLCHSRHEQHRWRR